MTTNVRLFYHMILIEENRKTNLKIKYDIILLYFF